MSSTFNVCSTLFWLLLSNFFFSSSNFFSSLSSFFLRSLSSFSFFLRSLSSFSFFLLCFSSSPFSSFLRPFEREAIGDERRVLVKELLEGEHTYARTNARAISAVEECRWDVQQLLLLQHSWKHNFHLHHSPTKSLSVCVPCHNRLGSFIFLIFDPLVASSVLLCLDKKSDVKIKLPFPWLRLSRVFFVRNSVALVNRERGVLLVPAISPLWATFSWFLLLKQMMLQHQQRNLLGGWEPSCARSGSSPYHCHSRKWNRQNSVALGSYPQYYGRCCHPARQKKGTQHRFENKPSLTSWLVSLDPFYHPSGNVWCQSSLWACHPSMSRQWNCVSVWQQDMTLYPLLVT